MKKDQVKVKAVIFDLDGVILDTERLAAEYSEYILGSLGYHSDGVRDFYIKNCIGHSIVQSFEMIQKHFGIVIRESAEEFIQHYRKLRMEYFRNNPPKVMKGFFELMDFLKGRGIKTAICSGTWYENIYQKADAAGLSLGCFDVVVGGDMVAKGREKPNPDIYYLTCEKLGVDMKNAMAIEDSDTGAMAAINAGIRTVLIPDLMENSAEIKVRAWKVLRSLDEVVGLIK
jgi:HAD superfamily hydrolase (TIGR01509 family)